MTSEHVKDDEPSRPIGWRSPDIEYDPIRSRLHVTRRLGTTVSIIGIGTAQLAAHLGIYDAPNLRLYELFGVVSLVWVVVFWWLPWPRAQEHAPAVMSISCLGLVLGTVALTGAGDSLAWVYAMPLAFYNGLYFRPKIAVALVPLFMATGMIPAAATRDWDALRDQALIVAPVYVIVTMIGVAVVPNLRRTGEARLQSALALQRAADAESWTRRLESVQDVLWETHQSSSVEKICAAMVSQIRRAIDYDSCLVHVVEGDTLATVVSETDDDGKPQHAAHQRHLNVAQRLAAWVAREARPLLLDDVSLAAPAPHLPTTAPRAESALAVPLTGHGEIVGVLTLHKSGRAKFTADDLRAMTILGDHAGTAISNAQLLAPARHNAEIDGLTGLLNQSASRSRLGTLLAERQPDQKLSVLMIDLNDFKPVNDALGHLAGDNMLHRLADILRTSCRRGDVVARCGGDEFMVILPEAGPAAAQAIGDVIEKTAATEGADLGITDLIPISLSFGVATAPDDGETVTDLLEAADARLYDQKRQRDPFWSAQEAGTATVAVAAE